MDGSGKSAALPLALVGGGLVLAYVLLKKTAAAVPPPAPGPFAGANKAIGGLVNDVTGFVKTLSSNVTGAVRAPLDATGHAFTMASNLVTLPAASALSLIAKAPKPIQIAAAPVTVPTTAVLGGISGTISDFNHGSTVKKIATIAAAPIVVPTEFVVHGASSAYHAIAGLF